MSNAPAPDAVRLAFHCESARLVPLLRQEAHRLGKGIPSDRPGIHKDLWTAALIIEQAEEAFAFNQKAAFVLAVAPAPATARGGDALRIAVERLKDDAVYFDHPEEGAETHRRALCWVAKDIRTVLAALASQPQATGGDADRLAAELVQGLAPDQGEAPGWAWGLAVRLQAALASQPQATGVAVEREVLKHACEHCQRMTKVPAETLSLATQPAPSPGGAVNFEAIAKDAAERVHKNGGCVPQLAFAPILFALQDALATQPTNSPGDNVPEGMMTLTDELIDKADEMDAMDARGDIWGLEEVSDLLRRAAAALPAAPSIQP